MITDKPLPNNPKIEESIIGACIRDNQAYIECRNNRVKGDYFYNLKYRSIWNCIEHLSNENNGGYDWLTVSDALKNKQITQNEILDIFNNCPTTAYITPWIKILIREYSRRQMIDKCRKYHDLIYNDEVAFDNECEKFISETRNLIQISQDMTIKDNAQNVIEAFAKVNNQSDNINKFIVPYCIDGMDDIIHHSRKGIHVLAAMPGTGKTGFALSLLNEQFMNQIRHVIFCNETTSDDLIARLFAIGANIESSFLYKIKTLPASDFSRKFMPTVNRYTDNSNMFKIFGKGEYTHSPSGISSKLAGLRDNGFKTDMVTIDYLQTMISPANPKASEHEKIQANVFELSRIFTEFNVAGLVLSQYNRDKSRDTGGRQAVMGDLKGSSSIEAEADIISFLQRQDKEATGVIPVKWYSDKVRGPKPINCQLEFNSANGRFLKVLSQFDSGRSYK